MTALPLPDESDDGLMERARSDDPAAFAELYDRHAAPALAVARSVCQNAGQAEDAVQDGFLSIWRGLDSYSPRAGGTFRGWAMEVVRNRAIDAHRRRSALKRPRISSDRIGEMPEATTGSALDDVVEEETRHALEGHLAQLPEAQAEVIALAFFGELTHAEIASQLSLPPGTVKGRMRLGLEKLRRGMDPSG